MGPMTFFVLFWLAPIFIGYRIGVPKHRAGWAWGLLLGWVGVIIVTLLSDKRPRTALI